MSHVAGAVHECNGYVAFDGYRSDVPGDRAYWALRTIVGQDHRVPCANEPVAVDGEEWHVSLGFQDSGLEPRRADDVEDLYEYRLNADGDGERKVRLLVQPRLDWADPERRPQSVPADMGLATNVKFQLTNVHPSELQTLIPRLFAALFSTLGIDWNDRYFTGPFHEYSVVTGLELYVRPHREFSPKLVGSTGVFRRLFDLVADEEGSSVVYSADNTEVVGYNHQLRFDRQAAQRLFADAVGAGQRRGFQVKHYHPREVRGEDRADDPLYHPKVGVLFKKSLNGDRAVPLTAVTDLLAELEENLVNILEWGEVPTEPGGHFVPDDHFQPTESDRAVEIYDDPTPRIEREQETVILRTLSRLEESDRDVVSQLVADGGRADVDELAAETGWSQRTVYRVLQRLDDLLGLEDGRASFLSEKIKQEVREHVRTAERAVDVAESVISDLLGIDQRDLERKGRAFQRWCEQYGVRLDEDSRQLGDDEAKAVDETAPKLRARVALSEVKSLDVPDAATVAQAAITAWRRTGRDVKEICEARLVYEDAVTGERVGRRIGSLARRA